MSKKWKLHLTDHHQKNIKHGVPGHDYDVDDVQQIVDNPEHEYTQEDGRKVFYSWLNKKPVKAVLSCTPFSTAMAGIVTVYRSRIPKKKPDDK